MIEYLNNIHGFYTAYLWIAIVSTGLFILQSVFTFLELGDHFEFDSNFDGHAEFDLAHGIGMPFHLFTVRGIIGFLMLFGWSGFIFGKAGLGFVLTLLLAFICGFIMMFIISLIYYFVNKLGESGNVDLQKAIGKQGEVYIPIPGEKQGSGKVSIILNSSLRELEAITYHEALKSGEVVTVIDIINDKLVVEKKH